jgi:hypothetical protein
MISPSTDRGLSEVLGAILMFALVFAVLVIVQVFAVPTTNAQLEVSHNDQLEADYGGLATAADRVATLGGSESLSIDAGVRYPSRLFLVNPPPASYTFASGDAERISLANVRATDDEAAEYFTFDGTPFTVETRSYTHSTDYNQYTTAPDLRIEGGVIYERSETGYVSVVSDGPVVDGRRISLVSYAGEFGSGGSETLDLTVTSLSGPSQRVTVGDTGTPMTLTLYTELPESVWETDLLEGEYDPSSSIDGAYVSDVSCLSGAAPNEPCDGDIQLTFESGAVYELTLSRLSLDAGDALGAKYLVYGGPATPSVSSTGTDLTVQVRDELNNPVSGQPVTFVSGDGEFDGEASPYEVTTDQDGYASATFVPDGDGPVDVTVEYDLDGSGGISDYERVEYGGLLVDGRDESTNSGVENDIINPSTGTVVLTDVSIVSTGGGNGNGNGNGGGSDDYIKMEFTNLADADKTITDARVNFYYAASPGGSGGTPPVSARLSYDDFATGEDEMTVGGAFVDVTDRTISDETGSNVVDIDLKLYTDGAGTTTYGPPNADDFIVVTFVYDDGTVGTYFVQNFD